MVVFRDLCFETTNRRFVCKLFEVHPLITAVLHFGVIVFFFFLFLREIYKEYLIDEFLSRVVKGEDQQVEREQHQEVFTGSLKDQPKTCDTDLTAEKQT